MRALGYSKGTSLVVLLIRNNEERKLNPAASFPDSKKTLINWKLPKNSLCQLSQVLNDAY